MLFALNSRDSENSSSHSKEMKENKKESSSLSAEQHVAEQQQQAAQEQESLGGQHQHQEDQAATLLLRESAAAPAAPLFSINTPAQPLFQVSEHSSTHQAPAPARASPLFQISEGSAKSRSAVAAATAEAASEAGQLAPLWNNTTSTATASPSQPAPLFRVSPPQQQQQQPLFRINSELISVSSSSASNSQSSFFASPTTTSTQPPQPRTSNNNNNNNMNVNLLDNVSSTTNRSNSNPNLHPNLHFGGLTHNRNASTPDFLSAACHSSGTDTGIPFPTLHQVKQQSNSNRRLKIQQQHKKSLTDQQKATLNRVTRLAARMCGCPVAVISGTAVADSSSSSSSSDPPILSQHGMTHLSWRAQAMRVLKADPEAQRSSGLPFYEHVPLNGPQSRRRVGTLTLMTRDARPALTPDERQDLDDLVFLATQALEESSSSQQQLPPPAAGSMRRQVSDTSATSSNNKNNKNGSNPRKARRRRASRDAMEHHPTTTTTTDMDEGMDHSTHNNCHLDGSQDDTADPSKCIIACTAHDLLTPLMGLQLSLSLLQEDAKFVRHLEEQPLQRESFWTAWQSTEVMFRMCQTTIDTLRANKEQEKQPKPTTTTPPPPAVTEVCNLDVTVLLQSLQRLMDPIPKQVPLILTLASLVPNQVPIVTTKQVQPTTASLAASAATTNSNTVDWHILRCALTVLSHACRVSTTTTEGAALRKPIQMRIGLDKDRLVVECDHDCPETLEMDETGSLALQSVAHQMQAVHEGQHGFERKQDSRAVFWFSVPVEGGVVSMLTTTASKDKDDRVITLLPQSHANDPSQGTDEMPSLAPMMDCSEPEYRRANTTTPPRTRPTQSPRRQQPKTSVSPSFKGRGLRRLRRSSTGSTNTLGSRRRTFHDMAGLRNERGRNQRTPSSNHVPLVLPTMIKAQSTATAVPSYRPLSGHKRNFQYPSSNKRSVHPSTTTTAQSAMAAAFQASLHNISTHLGQDNRLSYSVLQEQRQQDREKLQPQLMTMSASERSTGSRTNSGGLDRCFKDLMGSSARTADEIPQRIRERLHSSRSSGSNINSPGSQRPRKALVIEDSLVIRKTVARALTKLGIQSVVQACDGLEGVARMQEDVFDITLCDFSMPNLGGIDCVKQYRQWEKDQLLLKRPKQYIVGMSAHASPNDIAQGLQVGMNEYHPKPLTIKRLTELLQSTPLQEARCALDLMWQREQSQSQSQSMPLPQIASPVAMTPRGSLFADFTTSTVTMLDAMNTSGRSSTSYEDSARLDASSAKRPKTEGLFSLAA